MKISNQSFSKLVACATLLLGLGSCSGGGSGGGSTTAPPTPAAAPEPLTINSPPQGAANLPPGPVRVKFDIQNSPVPLSATQARMHFFVDNDPVAYKFYDGPGITEDGSTSGVRYQGLHTHFVHWKSGGSIQLNALASGPHQVQFVLGDAMTNLVTAYGMDEGSGTTLADASGSGHTGTLVNGPTWVASQATYGQALLFDDFDDAVSVANPGTYNFGTADFTLETWLKRNTLGGAQRDIFNTCSATTWEAGCKELYIDASNQLLFATFSTGDILSVSPIIIADTAWHHIAVTFNNSTTELKFYVDGALANTVTQALEADGAGHVVTVGNLFGRHAFGGLLDEFRIFSRVLTQAEIQAEMTSPSTAKTLTFTISPGAGGEFSLQEVASGLNFPDAMATAPDGRIFVNELQKGNIRVVTPTAKLPWKVQATPFATLQLDPVGQSEKGLLGIAVHPNFSQNGFVYVFYTATGPVGPVNRVVRFTAATSGVDTVATSATPEIIFDNIPAAEFHNGGFIQFGPDGKLYIFVGENNLIQTEAQSLSTLKGKILRINPDGTIPATNPFVSTLSAPFSAIYSLGHRNSFGFTFHPLTNDLWETENGDNTDDQVNRIVAGGNYGWPICPGICDPPNPLYIDPIVTYNPCCIGPTGIVAFRADSVYPAQYHNTLLFADFNFGRLWQIVLGGPMLTDFVSTSVVSRPGVGGLLSVMHGLNLPGQDGYIYVSNVGGSIFRVVLN